MFWCQTGNKPCWPKSMMPYGITRPELKFPRMDGASLIQCSAFIAWSFFSQILTIDTAWHPFEFKLWFMFCFSHDGDVCNTVLYCMPWYQGSWGQHGAHLGPTGPKWAPCWPHELCYLGGVITASDCSNLNLCWVYMGPDAISTKS